MTERKDDGGPFHPSAEATIVEGVVARPLGASFRAVAAMHLMCAWAANPYSRGSVGDGASFAVGAVDILIAELKK
jgi:hypothetical protein